MIEQTQVNLKEPKTNGEVTQSFNGGNRTILTPTWLYFGGLISFSISAEEEPLKHGHATHVT